MQTTSFLLGLLPLIAFVIFDAFFGMRYGLISAIVFAFIEAGFSLYYFGELDSVTLASLILVLIMAAAALKSDSKKLFLFQPVILSAGIGLYLILSYFLGHPIILEFALKYKSFLPSEFTHLLNNPMVIKQLKYSSLTMGLGLMMHASATAYAALKLSKWWWLSIRGVGIYVFILFAAIAARVMAGL